MRDMFDRAIGVLPPSTIDIDAIVTRKRRYLALRSYAAVTAASGLAAAAVVATVALIGTGGGVGQPVAGTSTRGYSNPTGAQATASPAESPGDLPSRPAESPTQVEQRIAVTLTDQLTRLLPGVHLNDRRTKVAGIKVYPVPGSDGYLASARVVTQAGTGTLTSLSSPRHAAQSPSPSPGTSGPAVTSRPEQVGSCDDFWAGSHTAPAHPDDRQCAQSRGPEGQIVLSAVDKITSTAIRYEVVVLWAHSYVDVTLENYFEGWEGQGDPPNMTFMPVPQLTLAQLATVAGTPALGV
jgi:hypothetical protein